MNRRTFLTTSAVCLVAASPIATTPLMAGEGTEDYIPGLISQKLAAGETVLVDYAAEWCGVCKRQERVIEQLRAENPAFNDSISFVRVDWDQFSSHEVTRSRNVPRRSTLILLKGDEELGRIVAGTSQDQIKSLLELGVSG